VVSNPLWPADRPGEATPGATCEDCAWRKPGTRRDRCLRHEGRSVRGEWAACPAHTRDAALDCLACGACCREAYHTVEVGPRDPFVRAHPELLHRLDGRLHVLREGPRCACLGADYRCVVYADRPRTCRDFERAGPNCVDARRRVGLTP
jgi:hypothetical protein